MAKVTATQKKALENADKYGFTWSGDSIATTYRAARRAILSLVASGFLVEAKDDYGTHYSITEKGRDYLLYGIAA